MAVMMPLIAFSTAVMDRTQTLLVSKSLKTIRPESCTGWLFTIMASAILPKWPMAGT